MALKDDEIRFIAATQAKLEKMPVDQAERCVRYLASRVTDRWGKPQPRITEAEEARPAQVDDPLFPPES